MQVPGFSIPQDAQQAEKKCSLLAAAFCRYAELGDWDKLAALLAGLQVGQRAQPPLWCTASQATCSSLAGPQTALRCS